jgi:hypothetical protein
LRIHRGEELGVVLGNSRLFSRSPLATLLEHQGLVLDCKIRDFLRLNPFNPLLNLCLHGFKMHYKCEGALPSWSKLIHKSVFSLHKNLSSITNEPLNWLRPAAAPDKPCGIVVEKANCLLQFAQLYSGPSQSLHNARDYKIAIREIPHLSTFIFSRHVGRLQVTMPTEVIEHMH